MHNLEAAQLDALVAALGDMAADRDLCASRGGKARGIIARGIMDSIRVILGGSRNTPKIDQAIVDIDNYIADMYNTQ